MSDLQALVFICAMVFLGGFIDAIAGGGGLITLPAYLLTGIPVHFAYGANKLTGSAGTTFAALKYFRCGALDLKPALISAAGAFAGSALGAKSALYLDEQVLKSAVSLFLPFVAVFLILHKNKGEKNLSGQLTMKRRAILALLIGFAMGFYDGILGPGTGTFAIIAYNALMKYDLKTASGNAKVLNLASNYAACFTFILAGTVEYRLAVPAMIFAVAGNLLGASLAIRKGSRFIRPVMVLVIFLLLGKMLLDLFV
ncbi:MAG: TSUP family transporter [Peptococcaceae bacterium]|nr:TSUP family transporter [Peptococcaceae bacterium]